MQYLTRPDGSIPPGALVPAGARLTRPTAQPAAPDGHVMLDLGDGQQIDGVWRQRWTAVPVPPPPVPQAITPLQVRRALRAAGLLDAVQALVAQAHPEVLEKWEYALEIPRDDPDLAALAQQMGLTPAMVDDLFRDAATR